MAYYLAINTVAGSSTDVGHVKWIELEDFTFSASEGSVSELSLNVADNDALVFFLKSLADQSGGVQNMTIHQTVETAAGPKVVYALELQAAHVTSLSDGPTEGHQVSLAFDRIEISQTGLNANGTTFKDGTFGWNTLTNQQSSAAAASPGTGTAAGGGGTTWFMFIKGVNGGSLDSLHEGWFELANFELSAFEGGAEGFVPVQAAFQNNLGLQALLTNIIGDGIPGGLDVVIQGMRDLGGGQREVSQAIYLTDVLLSNLTQNSSESEGSLTTIAMDYINITVDTFAPGAIDPSATFGYNRETGAGTIERPTVDNQIPGSFASQAEQLYLVIDGLEGNSGDLGRAGWFDVTDFSFSIDRPVTLTGEDREGTLPEFSALNLSITDEALLAQALSVLGNIGTLGGASLIGTSSVFGTTRTVFEIDLENISFASLGNSQVPGMNLSLAFDKIEFEVPTFDKGNGAPMTVQQVGYDLLMQALLQASGGAVAQATPGTEQPAGQSVANWYLAVGDSNDGFKGTSSSVDHPGWFEVKEFSLDALSDVTTAEFGRLQVSITGLEGLLKFMQFANKGDMIDALNIEGQSATGVVSTLRAGNIRVANVELAPTSGGGEPVYHVLLDYKQIEVTNTNPTTGATKTDSWNLTTNTDAVNIAAVDAPTASGLLGMGDELYFAMPGLRGDSTEPGHQGWFTVKSFSTGIEVDINPTSITSTARGLEIILDDSPAMGNWLNGLLSGAVLPAATLHTLGNGQLGSSFNFGNLVLQNVQVITTQSGPQMSLLFSYEQIQVSTYDYISGNPAGVPGPIYGYDYATSQTDPGLSDVAPPPGANASASTAPNFMLIDGFTSGNPVEHHGGWFELGNFAIDVTAQEGGLPQFGNVTVQLLNNAGLNAAMKAAMLGQTISGVVLDSATALGDVLSQIALGQVKIVSIEEFESTSGDSGYTLVLSYEQITVTHFSSTGVPTQVFGWDTVAESYLATPINATVLATNRADTITGTQNNDVLQGLGNNDYLYGGRGNDSLDGGTGNDRLYGDLGTDTVTYASASASVNVDLTDTNLHSTGGAGLDLYRSIENIIGSNFADQLTGSNFANRIEGGTGADTINGLAGADVLVGGAGIDILSGGTGADQFVLSNLSANHDEITDFAVKVDDLVISASLFGGGLTAGNLSSGQFLSNTTGAITGGTTQTRFIYDSAQGFLFYDSDGTGMGAAQLIAKLTGTPNIGVGDFLIIA